MKALLLQQGHTHYTILKYNEFKTQSKNPIIIHNSVSMSGFDLQVSLIALLLWKDLYFCYLSINI